MKKSKAAEHLNVVVRSLQRYRGFGKDILGPGSAEICFTDEHMAETWPWIWGDKCPLPSIVRILDHYEASGELAAPDYYNFMVVLFRRMPEIALGCQLPQGPWLSEHNNFPQDIPSLADVFEGWEDD